ncbi:MAG: sigma-70 family RNA polymerase sigma factor [Planctomycetota bacterium]|jgi:RNA polymerase sigma-32 factor
MTYHDHSIQSEPGYGDGRTTVRRMSVRTVRFLEREEERDLLRAWRDHRDETALAKLARSHRPMVLKIATKLGRSDESQLDLVQEGFIGLIEAANRFDLTREVRFATYAKWWIQAAIKSYLLRDVSIVRFVRTAEDKALYYNMNRLRRRLGVHGALTPDSKQEIARILGVRLDAVDRMEQFLEGRDRSTQETVRDDSTMSLEDRLEDPSPTPEDVASERDEHGFRVGCLEKALGDLSERERIIVVSRRLREDKVMLRDLGQRFGISKERVRQIEKAAIEKLHAATLGYAGASPAPAEEAAVAPGLRPKLEQHGPEFPRVTI